MNIKRVIRSRIRNWELHLSKTSKKRYINYLRKQGVKIGENIWMTPCIKTVNIDITRPSLVEIVARFGSDRERIGFNAFRLVVPVTQLAADPQTFLLRRSFVGRRKACSCCKQYDNDFLHLCCVFSLTEKWSCFSVPKAKKQRGFLTCK